MTDTYIQIPLSEFEALAQARSALSIEQQTQRLMIERLGLAWTPGEPFYALVEDEIRHLRDEGLRLAADYATQVTVLEAECDQWQRKLAETWQEVERLRRQVGE